MNKDDIQDNLNTWGAVLLVVFAVAWGMVYKGVSGETLADAVKDIGGALVPIFAAVFAARLVQKDLPAEQRYRMEGERAMRAVQGRHPRVLQGPKYSRKDYDPEKGGKGDKHLFVQTPRSGQKAALAALQPLEEGVVAINVRKGHLKFLGKADSDEAILSAREAVRDTLTALMKELDPQDKHHELLDVKQEHVAIAIDLDEEAMGPRRFRQTVEKLLDAAVATLESQPSATPSA